MASSQPFQSDLTGIPPSTSNELRGLFFALFPDANALKAIDDVVAMLASKYRASGRCVKSHRRHMTLHFVDHYGLRPEDVIERLKRVGADVVAKGFEVQLDIVGSFPKADKPWWIGTRVVSEELKALRNAIVEGECRSRGKLASRSTFTPHVTLFRQNHDVLETFPVDPIRWRVDSFCLIDSVFGSHPKHNLIAEWILPKDR